MQYLTKLTSLELEGSAAIQGLPAGLLSLSALIGLRRLHIPQVGYNYSTSLLWVTEMLQLTSLQIGPRPFTYDTRAPFSALSQLQQLVFSCGDSRVYPTMHGTREGVYDPQLLEDLPSSLTQLQLNWTGVGPLDIVQAPALAMLTAMQHLVLVCGDQHGGEGGIMPQYLASMLQLRVLKLHGLHADAMPVLLDVLPGMIQLEELELELDVYPLLQELQQQQLQPLLVPLPEEEHWRYAALLPPSPALRRVAFYSVADSVGGFIPALPAGCAAHLLAAGRVYPLLQELLLTPHGDAGNVYSGDYTHVPQVFGAGDMGRLVACCPNLESLRIPGTVQRDVDFSPLLQLPRLTELSLAGDAIDDDVAQGVLRRLTQLRQLEVVCSNGLTDVGMLALTSLRQLTYLLMKECGIAEQPLYHFHGSVELTATKGRDAVPDPAPDVWKQLLQLCINSDICCPIIAAALNAADPPAGPQQQQQQQDPAGMEMNQAEAV